MDVKQHCQPDLVYGSQPWCEHDKALMGMHFCGMMNYFKQLQTQGILMFLVTPADSCYSSLKVCFIQGEGLCFVWPSSSCGCTDKAKPESQTLPVCCSRRHHALQITENTRSYQRVSFSTAKDNGRLLHLTAVVQCCFTSTETARTVRDGEPRTATSTFIQLNSVWLEPA